MEDRRTTRKQTSMIGLFGVSFAQFAALTYQVIPQLVYQGSMVLTILTPLQVGAFKSEICSTGIPGIISVGLWLLAAVLIGKSAGPLYKALDRSQSRSSGAQKQSGSNFFDAGVMIVGGGLIASLPPLLTAMGVTLLGCLNGVPIL